MSEIIDLALLDADAVQAANHGLKPEIAALAWPECARHDWMMRYYQQVELNERAVA